MLALILPKHLTDNFPEEEKMTDKKRWFSGKIINETQTQKQIK